MKPIKQAETGMPRRAYPYSRFSSFRQRNGDSLRRQRDWQESVCARYGFTLDDTEEFIDRATSARHGKNSDVGALARFLEMVRRSRITQGSVLLVESLDRLSREEVGEAFDLIRGILRSGITVVTREPERVYNPGDENNMLTILEWLFIAARAYEESQVKSMRAAEAWGASRDKMRQERAPHQARPPWWVRRVPEGYQLDEEQAAALRFVIQLLRKGEGLVRACSIMNKKFAGPSRSGRWTTTGLHTLLKRRDIVGEFQPHRNVDGRRVPDGPPIPGYYPALLTEEEYLEVKAAIGQRLRKRGRPSTAGENLFTGMVWDALTKRPMSQHQAGEGNGKERYRYLHVNGEPGGRTCVRYEDFESTVLDAIAMLRSEDVLDPSSRSDEREQRIAKLTARQTALIQRKEQLQKAAADPDQDAADLLPSLARVSADLKETSLERERLQLETRSSRAEALAEAQTLRQLRDAAQGEEREELNRRIKAALPSVVAEIWVQAQKLTARRQVLHVQIFLRSGAVRYVQILPRRPKGIRPWQFESEGVDLRKGAYPASDASNRTADAASA